MDQIAKAQQEAQSARKLAASIEAEQRPRTLMPVQQEVIVKGLKRAPKGKVIVAAVFGDTEAGALAAEFQEVFKAAGFYVGTASWGLGSAPGVFVMTKTTNSPPHALKIIETCAAAGIPFQFETDTRLGDDDVRFVVSSKLPGWFASQP